MSKITINLNSIINTLCDNRYDTLENRIRSASSKLFDYEYITDEEARKTFELLFCTTYIERNIYTPSVALFKLRLKSELQALAPVFNHSFEVLNADFKELADRTETVNEGENESKSSGIGTAKGLNVDSRFPQDVITSSDILGIEHAEYGSRNESETEQETESRATASSTSITTNSGKLDLMLKYNQLKEDLIMELVNKLSHLFLMIY